MHFFLHPIQTNANHFCLFEAIDTFGICLSNLSTFEQIEMVFIYSNGLR